MRQEASPVICNVFPQTRRHRFKNVMFDISPTEEVGDFEVKAKFMGVEMEKVQLHFQVNISSETSLPHSVTVGRRVVCA